MYIQHTLELDERNIMARLLLASLKQQARDPEGADAEYSRVLRMDPTNVAALVNRFLPYTCVAACCSVLQCVAVCCSASKPTLSIRGCYAWIHVTLPPSSTGFFRCHVLQCVAVCCGVLQCVAVCCSVLQCVAVCCSVSPATHCNTLQLTATHCNRALSVVHIPASPPPPFLHLYEGERDREKERIYISSPRPHSISLSLCLSFTMSLSLARSLFFLPPPSCVSVPVSLCPAHVHARAYMCALSLNTS